MSNVAKLKKQAAELEQKKQFDKALAVYVKLLEAFDKHPDELDVALFNRVGDLMLRQGNVADAVDYYEKAVDHYADTGFFNNAIALCNKILRHSPGRASIYYKLGKISAQKGFKNDAKVNFLEYADRMQKSGKVDEAFRALNEFADLCPDQDEIRLMLADQLTKANRQSEAVDQLQTLYERYESEGRVTEATATVARMRSIDPSVEPRSGSQRRKNTSADLVFLDLDTPAEPTTSAAKPPPPARKASVAVPAPKAPAAPAAPPSPPRPRAPAPVPAPAPAAHEPPPATPSRAITPIAQPIVPPPAAAQEENDLPSFAEPADEQQDFDTQLTGIVRLGDDVVDLSETPSQSLLGLEATQLSDDVIVRSTPSSSFVGLDPTPLELVGTERLDSPPSPASAAPLDDMSLRGSDELEFMTPDAAPTPSSSIESIDFDLSTLEPSRDAAPESEPVSAQAALEGLPLMDLDDAVALPAESPSEPSGDLTSPGDLELVEDFTISAADELAADEPAAPVDHETTSPATDPAAASSSSSPRPSPPAPAVIRPATREAAHSVEILGANVEREPDNWSLRRQLAEAMLEAGNRNGGIRELETAMSGAERSGNLEFASSLAEEIARLEPGVIKHHQKRVEYAFRTNDRPKLIEAYLSLADALLQSDQPDKARTVYQRVIDLAPDELRAQTALETIAVPEARPALATSRRGAGGVSRRVTSQSRAGETAESATTGDSFVNLGDWLRDDEAPKDLRMVVAEQEPSGDEAADFADMLRKFKQGVAENVDAEDYQSHYDLAIAFREMGLLDEAISEFQKALASPANRVPTYEALGQCFLDKGQFKVASSILSRALNEGANEEQLVGVLYLLGLSAEAQGSTDEALAFYQRVYVLDIQFRDISDRLSEVERGRAAR
jgi:tetratricopeptide (TPR) repeat protein